MKLPSLHIDDVVVIPINTNFIQLSRKLSELVLENHPAYARELQRVMDLQQTLQKANIICVNGRRYDLNMN